MNIGTVSENKNFEKRVAITPETAKKYNVILIEDCCDSHVATYKGKKVGTFGDMSLFSFYYEVILKRFSTSFN